MLEIEQRREVLRLSTARHVWPPQCVSTQKIMGAGVVTHGGRRLVRGPEEGAHHLLYRETRYQERLRRPRRVVAIVG